MASFEYNGFHVTVHREGIRGEYAADAHRIGVSVFGPFAEGDRLGTRRFSGAGAKKASEAAIKSKIDAQLAIAAKPQTS